MTTVAAPQSGAVVTWRWIALALALSQLAAPTVVRALAGDFLSSGATNEAAITPSGYAFGIWGVICLLSAATAIGVARYGLGARWEMGLLIDASVVFVGFSVWLAVAAQDWLWASVVVIVVMFGGLVDIMRLLARHRDDLTCPRWVTRLATLTFGLYLGWTSIATFANVAAALIAGGWSPTETGWQTVILVAATAVAATLTVILRASVGYVAAVLWALVAIALGAAHRDAGTLSLLAAIAAVTIAGTATVTVLRLRRA